MVIGTFATVIGAWIRVLGQWSFWPVLIGQVIAAMGQPFILNAPPKLAGNWFPGWFLFLCPIPLPSAPLLFPLVSFPFLTQM